MKMRFVFISTFTIMTLVLSCSSSQPNGQTQSSEIYPTRIDTTLQGRVGLPLEERLKDLSSQISARMSEGQKQKIAVIEFSDLNGRITDFGKFLSEEFAHENWLSRLAKNCLRVSIRMGSHISLTTA